MRRVTFTTAERTVLVPVEISYMKKPVLVALLLIFFLSGIGPQLFSFGAAWSRGGVAALALLAGILGGAVITPVLLPWIPGAAFSLKGALTGGVAGLAVMFLTWGTVGGVGGPAVFLFTVSMSSPSGVEKEMRRAIPLQACALLLAVVAWVASAFTG